MEAIISTSLIASYEEPYGSIAISGFSSLTITLVVSNHLGRFLLGLRSAASGSTHQIGVQLLSNGDQVIIIVITRNCPYL